MEHPESKRLILTTRRRAMVALCCAGYFAVNKCLFLFVFRPGYFFGFRIADSTHTGLALLTLDVLICGMFIYALVEVCRRFRGAERVLFAMLMGNCLLSPIKNLVSKPLPNFLAWTQLIVDLIMLVVAFNIYRSTPETSKTKLEANLSNSGA
ncbi:MAG: hypothetical protein ABR987_17320 [Terracidiphilus sp.]|jgi:hypothetical protein